VDAGDLFKLSTASSLEARRMPASTSLIERFEARPLRAFIGLGYAIARRRRVILEAALRSRLEVAIASLLVRGRQRRIWSVHMRQARIAVAGNGPWGVERCEPPSKAVRETFDRGGLRTVSPFSEERRREASNWSPMSEREGDDAAQCQIGKGARSGIAGAGILQLVKTFMLGVIEYVRCHRAGVRGESW
jgi:hypothetical protein